MQRLFITALACLISVSVFGQGNVQPIPLIAYWDNQQTHTFEVTKVLEAVYANDTIHQDTLTCISTFEVIDSLSDGYTIKWSYEYDKNKLTHPKLRFEETLANYENVEVIYTTDELGVISKIQNWKSISESMKLRYENVIDILISESGNSREKVLGNASQYYLLYNSPEFQLNSIFKELILFHYLLGYEYTVGDTLRSESEFANPLGSNLSPLKQNTETYISNFDTTNYIIDLEHISKANIHGLVDDYMNMFKEDPTVFEGAAINMYNYFRYHLSGIPLLAYSEKVTTMLIEGEILERNDIILIEFNN